MKKAILVLVYGLSLSLLLSGCIHRELIISGPSSSTATTTTEVETQTVETSKEATETTIIPRVSFPESEYRRLAKTGSGTVKGMIYLSDAYGKKIYGKQTRLYLNPVTSYSRQWYTESYIGGYKMAKADKKLFNYLRFTTSNTQGKFAFYGVPNGSYYVIGVVKCGQECGYSTPRSIRIAKEVTISGSETVDVDLGKMID
ncbi:MAG: carboxypeptidase regulatory-like domain-containing protein [Sulfurovum sp.]|nr:carboxypeptidase regulatory-like domain-containing protein [Sulfurovum sp.]